MYALLVLPNGDLVAGGSMTTAGSSPADRIARWDGVSWQAMGSGPGALVQALAVMPNGDIVALGSGGSNRLEFRNLRAGLRLVPRGKSG